MVSSTFNYHQATSSVKKRRLLNILGSVDPADNAFCAISGLLDLARKCRAAVVQLVFLSCRATTKIALSQLLLKTYLNGVCLYIVANSPLK